MVWAKSDCLLNEWSHLGKNSPDLFSAECWRRLRTVRKDALRSGTAADNPDRRCFWLQHSLQRRGKEGQGCGIGPVYWLTYFPKLLSSLHTGSFSAPECFKRLLTGLRWDGRLLSETEIVNGIPICSASPEDSWTVSRRVSGGWMDDMSPQQQQDSLSRGGGQQDNKRVSSALLWFTLSVWWKKYDHETLVESAALTEEKCNFYFQYRYEWVYCKLSLLWSVSAVEIAAQRKRSH